MVDKYLATVLADDNVAVTRGFTLALGALPARLLRPSVDAVLAVLDEMARPDRCVCIKHGLRGGELWCIYT